MSQPSLMTIIAPGVMLAGKYRLVRLLGEGAMGAVWAAINESTNREVALKLIVRPEPEFRLRLQREARALGALKHKNIIDIYDIEQTEGGDPFLVMQLLHGETVADLLARKRRLEVPEACRIARDVARALAAAHAVPIIHRDLKPANIFLHRDPGEEGEPLVKVLDFGVAKNLAHSDGLHTAVGGTVGSPLYMSPEQVKAQRDVDHRADIWALGVVLFEMLAGQRPFDGDATQIFARILSGPVPRVDSYVRKIPPALGDLVARCLQRERDQRYASAAEIAMALEVFMDPSKLSSAAWPRADTAMPPPSAVAPASAPTPAPAASPVAATRPPHGSGAAYPAYGSGGYPAQPQSQPQPPAAAQAAYPSGPYPAYGSGGYPAQRVSDPQVPMGADLDPDDAATVPIDPAMARAAVQRMAQQRGQAAAPAPQGVPAAPPPPPGWGEPQPAPPYAQAQPVRHGSGSWPQANLQAQAGPQPNVHQPFPATGPGAPSGAWPVAPAAQTPMPGQPRQPSSPEIPVSGRAPMPSVSEASAGAEGWAQGGTVKMGQEDVEAYRRQHLAGLKKTTPLPQVPVPGPGAVMHAGAQGAGLQGADLMHPQASGGVSTTTPLVTGSTGGGPMTGSGGAPFQSASAALIEEQRKRKRTVALVGGVLAGLVVAGVVVFLISGSDGPESAAPESAPSAVPSALPSVAPSAKEAEPAPQPVPTPSAAPSAADPAPAPSASAAPSVTATPPATATATATTTTTTTTTYKPPPTKAPAPKKDPCAGLNGFALRLCQQKQGK